MDASQYKDVILGLVFLKYVSDAFDERRSRLQADLAGEGFREDQIEPFLNDVDEYTSAGVFWVPPTARWRYLAEHAKGLPAAMGQPHRTIGEPRRRRDGPGDGLQPEPRGLAAAHLQPRQRRPAPPG
ncbi:type I restriction-modification system subunit M N-terminal domain-containing protein [Cellulomonas sp.]|uniref:type I restriction-modification system subunit M N-terminal domain-containing protein n=1 Tax=Cellulomonas sp. TaxID=40001 RepID=UPI0033905E71